MDQVLPSITAFTDSISGLVTSVNSDIALQITAAQEAAAESARAAELWYDTAQTLRAFLGDLTGSDLGGLNPFEQANARAAQYDQILAAALGGDQEAAASFESIARDYLDSALAVATTREDYNAIARQIMADTQLLAGVSTLEGANEDVLEDLFTQQAEILESLAAFLSYEDLTDEQLALLSDDLRAYVDNWDQTIATFDQALLGVEDAITQVGDLSYAALQTRLDVTVQMIANAGNLPDDVRDLLLSATDGVGVSIDFILRQELAPDLLWLAINAESEHLKAIDLILGNNALSAQEIDLALAASGQVTKTISLLLNSNLDDDVMRVALASTSELARVLNLYLDPSVDPDLMTLALSNIHDYFVAVHAALDPSVRPKIEQLVLEDAGIFALVVEVALDLPTNEAELLLQDASIHARNVYATLLTDALTPQEQAVLLNASSDALLMLTVSLVYPTQFTDAELAMMQEDASAVLRLIYANLAYDSGLTAAELDLLSQSSSTVARQVMADMSLSASGIQIDFLDALTNYSATTQRTIDGLMTLGTLSADEQAFLDAITGSHNGKVTLDGGMTLDVSTAFQNWYETTTQDMILDPMMDLRSSLDDLRASIQHLVDIESVSLLQSDLATAHAAQQALVPSAQGIVDQVEALEASTGVTLWDDDKNQNAHIGLNEAGRIVYNFDSLLVSNTSDLDAFRDEWDDLKDQIDAYNAQFLDYNSIINGLRNQISALGSVPAFASGGDHLGGLRLVGEHGPELEVTGPSRIYNHRDTMDMLSNTGGDSGEEMAALRREVRESKEVQIQMLRYIRDMYKDTSSVIRGQVAIELTVDEDA